MRSKAISSVVCLAAASALLLSACGSSSSGGNTSTTGSSGGTYKLGVLVDETGGGANTSGIKAVQAYVDYVNSQGGIKGNKLSYVAVDTTTTPQGTLTAAQKLVQQDHVFAIISVSLDTFAAEPFLLKAGVPVMGTSLDGPEWADPKNTNMFTTVPSNYDNVYSTAASFFKTQGVTSCSAIGYSDSPSSTKAAQAANASCKQAGLKAPYIDLVKFTTTDVGPIALAIKASGADALSAEVAPTIGFEVAAVLQQLGVKMKSILFADGYGGDLLASPAGIKAAQGYEFLTQLAPIELNTPATQLFAKNLAAVGVTTDPTFAQQVAYQSVAAFAAGAKAAPANASQAQFITAMRGVKNFTVDGLLAAPVSFSDYNPQTSCFFVVKLKGKTFIPLSQKAYCGGVVGSLS